METDPLHRNNVTVTGQLKASRTLVFVNGLGYDQSFWRVVASHFAHDYRLVLFDHVGAIPANQAVFKKHPVRYLNVGGYAADLLEIKAALNLTKDTILIGHSLGAMTALLACVEDPIWARQLVLIGASPCYANTGDYKGGLSKDDINAIYSALQSNYRAWAVQLAAMAMATPESPALIDTFAGSLSSIPPEMMLTVLCSVFQMDYRPALRKVSVPTLVIQSKTDIFVPPQVAQFLQSEIPNAQLKTIAATGHLPHVSAPESVIAAISEFIG